MDKHNLDYSEEQILEFVRDRRQHRRVFDWANVLVLPTVRKYLMQSGASDHDVRTVFLTALSDFFRKLENSAYELQPDSNFKGLLYKMCQYQWNKEHRNRARISGEAIPEKTDAKQPEQELINREKQAMVGEAVARLEQPYRGVLVLHEYCEVSHTEIAFAAGYASPGVSREIKSRAIKKLRDIFRTL